VVWPATKKQIAECREQLTWLRDHGFTFSMLEHDTGKSGGWCYKVINGTDRYTVTTIDVAVIRASYRSAFRLHSSSRPPTSCAPSSSSPMRPDRPC
jgi:hypothetical protein